MRTERAALRPRTARRALGPLPAVARRGARRLAAAGALAVAGALAAGCSSGPVSTASAVTSWAKAAGLSTSSSLLATDVAEVRRGIAQRRLTATHTACDGLGADAGTAVGVLPTPDQTLTDLLNRAYLTLARAAQDCSEANGFSANAFARFDQGAAKGMAALRAGEARYRLLVGSASR